jgi:hypothetical protein
MGVVASFRRLLDSFGRTGSNLYLFKSLISGKRGHLCTTVEVLCYLDCNYNNLTLSTQSTILTSDSKINKNISKNLCKNKSVVTCLLRVICVDGIDTNGSRQGQQVQKVVVANTIDGARVAIQPCVSWCSGWPQLVEAYGGRVLEAS